MRGEKKAILEEEHSNCRDALEKKVLCSISSASWGGYNQ